MIIVSIRNVVGKYNTNACQHKIYISFLSNNIMYADLHYIIEKRSFAK